MTKMADIPIFGKKNNFVIYYPGTSGAIRRNLYMYHQGLRPNSLFKLRPCVDHDLFSGNVKFCKFGLFIKKNVTVMDSLEIIASWVLEFATRIVQSLYFLNMKLQASSHLLWLHSPVCVRPGRKPQRPIFSERGSFYRRLNRMVMCLTFDVKPNTSNSLNHMIMCLTFDV